MAEPKHRTAPVPSTEMPKGIPYIVGNEAAERFSFYGMKAILVVFMTKYLLDSTGTKAPMSGEDAKFYVHLFVASAYFFPVIGALISDWLFGKYRTILSLSLVYCLGHLALALDETRLGLTLGLTLIAIGSGGIKPCVSAHVGDQFGKQNHHFLSKVFGWFYFSINLGAFASTLLTPKLLVWYGPSVAFGVPGALMLLATWVFWLGRTKFVHIPAVGNTFFQETFTREGLKAIMNLAMIYVFVAMFWALFDQTASAWVLQAESMDRHWLGVNWLSSQIQAVNPILILLFIPLFSYLIYPSLNRIFPLTPLRKISIGFFLTVLSFAVSAYIEGNITGGTIVQFKSNAGSSFQAASSADSEKWSARNIIDHSSDNSGWISPVLSEESQTEPSFVPQEIVIRLRERRSWALSGIKIDPGMNLTDYVEYRKSEDDTFEAPDSTTFQPREIEVLAGESRIGPWSSLGTITLQKTDAIQEFDFSDLDSLQETQTEKNPKRSDKKQISTEYVLLRILSNWGADAVCLNKVHLIASGNVPDDAHHQAAAVWPDVAAVGHKPSIIWQLLAYAILTAAEVMVSITCLEFSYTQAPKSMKSLIMSLYLLSVSAGNLFTSIVNKIIPNEDGSSKLPGAQYYWFFTFAMLITAVLFMGVSRFYRGQTYIQDEQPPEADEDQKPCPACGKLLHAIAEECEHCGEAMHSH